MPAIVLSAGIHLLAIFLFWCCCRGSARTSLDGVPIFDTRVQERDLAVNVCWGLLDSPPPTSAKRPTATAPERAQEGAVPRTSSEANNVKAMKPLEVNHFSMQAPEPSPLPKVPSNSTSVFQPGEGSTATPNSETAATSARTAMRASHDFGTGDVAPTGMKLAPHTKSVVYVLDRSVSMGLDGKLARAKQELLNSITHLSQDMRFQIILFNRSIEVLAPNQGLLLATLENKQRAQEFLMRVLPEGGTKPIPALKRALGWRPDVLYFLSDAEELTARDLGEVTLLNQGRSVIQVVAFDNEQSRLTLKALAQNNRGEVRLESSTPQQSWSSHGN